MATAFVPIAVVPADGARLDPERGRQLELGGQLELARGVRVERSVYDIRQTNVVVARPNGLFKQAGRLTSRGLELSTEVESSVGLRLRAGYAWTRARYDSYVSGDVDYSGKRPPFVFDHSATLWGTFGTRGASAPGSACARSGEPSATPPTTFPCPPTACSTPSIPARRGRRS